MKKTLAAVGASLIGLVGAVVGGAVAPASAGPAPVLPKCTDATQHVVNPDIDPATDSWYMTCVPQYGLGKAEFSITAPTGGFPDSYSLTDGHQTVTSSPSAAQVASYFGSFYTEGHSTAATYTGAFVNLSRDASADSAGTQAYDTTDTTTPMDVAFPVTSVSRLSTALPAACSPDGETYDAAYAITYAPTTTTFSELIGGEVYKTTVTLTAPTVELGLNFDSSSPGIIGPLGAGLDPGRALCASTSDGTIFASNFDLGPASTPASVLSKASAEMRAADVPTGPEAWIIIASDIATNDPFDVTTLTPETNDDLALTGGPFAVAATPSLAETGVNAAPAGLIGGSLLLLGAGAFALDRRRRSVHERG